MKYFATCTIALIVILPIALPGCNSASDNSGSVDVPPAADADTQTDEMDDGLAMLSPEDAQAVQQQQVCPVSGETLGVMGQPKKVDVNGRQIWICCDACRDALLADPDKYLAQLDSKN